MAAKTSRSMTIGHIENPFFEKYSPLKCMTYGAIFADNVHDFHCEYSRD